MFTKKVYSVARVSCTWSLTVFFSLINIAGINSQIIYYENTNKIISRRLFLKELGKELTKNHMTRRLQIPTFSFTLRQSIMKLTGYKSNEETTISDVVTSHTKRYFCPSRKNQLTKVKKFIFLQVFLFLQYKFIIKNMFCRLFVQMKHAKATYAKNTPSIFA